VLHVHVGTRAAPRPLAAGVSAAARALFHRRADARQPRLLARDRTGDDRAGPGRCDPSAARRGPRPPHHAARACLRRRTAGRLLSACCPVLVTTCAFLITEIPFTVLLLLTLLALSRQLEHPTALGATVAGLLCGYLVLMRSFAPALVAVAAAHLAVRGRGAGR